MTFLTKEQYALLRAGFTERYQPLLDFLVASGCRFSEATALTPSDVDRVNNTVRISKAWKRTPGSDEGKYELGQPKTSGSIRTVDVPKSVLDQLDYSREWAVHQLPRWADQALLVAGHGVSLGEDVTFQFTDGQSIPATTRVA